MANLIKKLIKVQPVSALSDNYMYIVWKDGGNKALAIDPVEPEKIKKVAQELQLNIVGSLVTHHHWDHAGGMRKFREIWSNQAEAPIYGGDDRIDELNHLVEHNEEITIGDELKIRCLSTPCHTRGHICYFITTEGNDVPVVLTGDTLFIAGCGRFFEGNAAEMNENLNVKLASLPDVTEVFPGHEYTASNLKFAHHVENTNKTVEEKLEWAKNTTCTVPSTIGEEKLINPFMRLHSAQIQALAKTQNYIEVMHYLREAKNSFK
ncbi:unnamed protein product [Auanema sp. JU1783]|nr:unnamed protein product [Auanema sp. JU1783]